MLMRLRVLPFMFVIAFLAPWQAVAFSREDSLAMATATVWSNHLKPQAEESFRGDSVALKAYVKGLAKAFSTPQEDTPYYSGLMQGLVVAQRIRQMQSMGFGIDTADFCDWLSRFIMGVGSPFTNEGANRYLNNYISEVSRPDTVDSAVEQAFVDRQLQKANTVKTASGLVFETVADGKGGHPKTSDKVRLLYTGRLSDGTVFDSTEKPVTFDVARLVKGFTEGLQLMRPGGIYRLYIPAVLGYGARGVDGVIPGNSALEFEVKLLEVITE